MEVTNIIDPNTIKTNLAGTTKEEVLEELATIIVGKCVYHRCKRIYERYICS